MLVHGGFGRWTYGEDAEQTPTRDELLDNFSLHWLTNTAASGARLYWENRSQNLISAAAQRTDTITLPVAITVFPDDDLFRAPETRFEVKVLRFDPTPPNSHSTLIPVRTSETRFPAITEALVECSR